MMNALLPAGTAFAAAVLTTAAVLWVGRRWQLVDVPNERSAHSTPIPTLGGIGIVVGTMAALPWLTLAPGVCGALLVCLLVLLLVIVDDLRWPFSAAGKLLLQSVVAALWVALSPAVPLQLTADVVLSSGWLSGLLAAAWLVCLMNMFNFMDGIDGLSASQAIVMSAGLGLLPAVNAFTGELAPVFMAACAGFLLFNAPRAYLFMGDVGSLSLGFVVGIMVLDAAAGGVPMWLAALPVAVYAVDTSTTVIGRLRRGENLLRAHRQHLYQRLVQAGWSHLQVDVVALLLTSMFSAAAVAAAWGQGREALICAGIAGIILGAGLIWKGRDLP